MFDMFEVLADEEMYLDAVQQGLAVMTKEDSIRIAGWILACVG